MGKERRRHERKPCAIPCDLEIGGKSVCATTRDISMGGLSVQADIELDQGDVVSVVLHPKRAGDVQIQAIVWHQRRIVQRSSGQKLSRLGLVLSEAPPDFHERLGLPSDIRSPLLEEPEEAAEAQEPEASPAPPPRPSESRQKRDPQQKRKKKTPPRHIPTSAEAAKMRKQLSSGPKPAAEAPKPGLPKPARYRVRVTLTGRPRTRSILVFASDDAEARKTALAETGEGWEILEVDRA